MASQTAFMLDSCIPDKQWCLINLASRYHVYEGLGQAEVLMPVIGQF